MRDSEGLPISTQTPTSSSSTFTRKESSESARLVGRYKFWALGAILLLAFWSMLTGTVSLRWSAAALNRFSDDFLSPFHDDLDVLEMEERQQLVKQMWDVYMNSRRIRLPMFWLEAFEVAYEELTSDDPGVREAAITEISKMSIRSIDIESLPLESMSVREFTMMQAGNGKMAIT